MPEGTPQSAGANANTANIAIERIQELAQELSPQVGLLSDWSKKFPRIEEVVDEFIESSIQGIPNDATDLLNVIKDRRARLSLSSGITSQIVGICQQILAFGAAGLALTVGFIDKVRQFSIPVQKLLAIIGIFYAELVLISLLVLIWYMLQARFRYPYLYFDQIGNAWPFFYYALITPVSRWPIQFAKQRFNAATSYAKDFVKFTAKTLQETPKERLRDELQQYFLLPFDLIFQRAKTEEWRARGDSNSRTPDLLVRREKIEQTANKTRVQGAMKSTKRDDSFHSGLYRVPPSLRIFTRTFSAFSDLHTASPCACHPTKR
jgi:hypothetical protein